MIKHVIGVTVLAFAANSAFAASCTATATEQKLAGAAKNSFMKKCETDAKATCEATAKEKSSPVPATIAS